MLPLLFKKRSMLPLLLKKEKYDVTIGYKYKYNDMNGNSGPNIMH